MQIWSKDYRLGGHRLGAESVKRTTSHETLDPKT